MKYTWKPETIAGADGKGVEQKVEGTVEVDLPKYVQRLKYLKEAKFKINPDWTVSDQVDNLEITIKAIELAEKHIKKVDLTVKETGDKIKTVDQMQFSPYCEECLTEIGFLVLNGPQLGKR